MKKLNWKLERQYFYLQYPVTNVSTKKNIIIALSKAFPKTMLMTISPYQIQMLFRANQLSSN